ncbi:alpha/beta hydrolase [Halobellus sp. Atlit-38R]|uniref:alpha/beta hydrolase n=1 Tax=Halobellus sp. Atlit-38R TaxID=2282131 RepID=UPI000EF26FD5|nr:alpha/beta hydrolase [Halobellus sp. Atlit-38R]RLM89836.1 alpha/beta hydrolase [Halobellus sp. Atlit-38R]
MSETILLPGGRDARGTLGVAADSDGAAADTGTDDAATAADACVVACPPHPQHGGHRGDQRLRAVSDELRERGIDCLRFDYGPWDGGRGERTDALNAVAWANERYDRVALFGFSFGASVALSAAAHGADVVAVAALAPDARLGATRAGPDTPDDGSIGGIDVVAGLPKIPERIGVQVLYGTRDDVVDVGTVVDAARTRGHSIVEFAADHFFIGQAGKVATAVADFFEPALQADVPR